jgi:hypothetical protein
MAYKNKNFEHCLPLIRALPDDTHFDISASIDKPVFSCQAYSHEQAARIRQSLPAARWEKHYDRTLEWWHWEANWEGINFHIYGCTKPPKTCKAITEKKTFEERVPTEWETRIVEKEVVVGWDCGSENGGAA